MILATEIEFQVLKPGAVMLPQIFILGLALGTAPVYVQMEGYVFITLDSGAW